jgi:cytochrome c biogenesis protein CcmG/thiol:disulfide interchange protein DsbE
MNEIGPYAVEKRTGRMNIFKIACALGLLAWMTAPVGAQDSVPKPGDTFPALTLNYLGSQPELSGKPVIVEFWATWCPPCRKSIPHLNEIYAKYKAQGLQIVGITDEDEGTVKKFQEKIPMNYNVAINTPQSIYKQFGIEGIPTAYLVDKGGKIVWTGHPMDLTESQLQQVLN